MEIPYGRIYDSRQVVFNEESIELYRIGMKYGWDNYLLIEKEFIEAQKYLSFERQSNFEADSPFLRNQIILLGSLVETSMKKLIEYRNTNKKFSPSNISEYKALLESIYPDIEKYSSKMINTDIVFTPFENWKSSKLQWWKAYSEIKHGGSRIPKLSHALNLLAAYEILLHLIHLEEARMMQEDMVFYSFIESPHLLNLFFSNVVCQGESIGLGYIIDQYMICDDVSIIDNVIEHLICDRRAKQGSLSEWGTF